MRAKSVRQLLKNAGHIEYWVSGVGWIAVNCCSTIPKVFRKYYRIVTVKGKAIA